MSDPDIPRCDKCHVECTSALMAAMCPLGDECAFFPGDESSQEFIRSMRSDDATRNTLIRRDRAVQDRRFAEQVDAPTCFGGMGEIATGGRVSAGCARRLNLMTGDSSGFRSAEMVDIKVIFSAHRMEKSDGAVLYGVVSPQGECIASCTMEYMAISLARSLNSNLTYWEASNRIDHKLHLSGDAKSRLFRAAPDMR